MNIAVKTITRERSFEKEIEQLLLQDGDVFHGETILAVTKALLQSGVSYIGGYPGAPVSHLMDVLADAGPRILERLGIYFEQSASEAGAAALLGASINYPIRGAVTWKSIVGTNVASDALSNLASAGVMGGALIVIGEDYGEGASVIQERTQAMAMKSSLPLIDPRGETAHIVALTEKAFELSEACALPVMMSLRIRACHMTGSFVCKDNIAATVKKRGQALKADFSYDRIVLPPSTYAQEAEKIDLRLPAAQQFIREHQLNEHLGDSNSDTGLIIQGGTHAVVIRALQRLDLADAFGKSRLPILVLNVVHPLIPDQVVDFIGAKKNILVVEEGNPAFLENQIKAFCQERNIPCRIHGKDTIPTRGEYITPVIRDGIARFLEQISSYDRAVTLNRTIEETVKRHRLALPATPPPRPPGFCTGCPERPVFSALKLLMQERGEFHVSMDIGCSSFATLPPFNVGHTILGYGLSLASGGAIGRSLDQPVVAIMGDGAFWHNGLATGVVNARWQRMNAVLIILDNGYASATGQQHLPSTGASPVGEPIQVSIRNALRGMGVTWIKPIDSYNVSQCKETIRQALDSPDIGLKVILSDNECMLARQRRSRRIVKIAQSSGKPISLERYGVDETLCTGDHSCIRLSGCPSLTIKITRNPLKNAPVAHVDQNCAACNLCGEVAQAARLCPSFYKVSGTKNSGAWQQWHFNMRRRVLRWIGASG